jgi:hypothetical protein
LYSRPSLSSIFVIGAIVLTIIVALGVATGLSTGLPSYPMKHTNCTSKVLELAQKGIVREVGGYYGAGSKNDTAVMVLQGSNDTNMRY